MCQRPLHWRAERTVYSVWSSVRRVSWRHCSWLHVLCPHEVVWWPWCSLSRLACEWRQFSPSLLPLLCLTFGFAFWWPLSVRPGPPTKDLWGLQVPGFLQRSKINRFWHVKICNQMPFLVPITQTTNTSVCYHRKHMGWEIWRLVTPPAHGWKRFSGSMFLKCVHKTCNSYVQLRVFGQHRVCGDSTLCSSSNFSWALQVSVEAPNGTSWN